MSAPLEENLEARKTGSLLENSHMSPAKPWEQGEEGTHTVLRHANHGAGTELADSSSTTTSAPIRPDRHIVAVKRERGLFWGEGKVGDNNGTDDKGSVRSSHHHWCTICKYPKMISTCDSWKRHMNEHEQSWPCNICARKDSAFTRKSNLVRHLSRDHDLSCDVASNLADKLRYSEIKKTYACGFCIQTFTIHSDQLNHIDREHWRRGQDISEWDLNKIIHGLLLQPNIQSSWRHLLEDTSSATQDFTWNTSKAEGLIRRLELNEEPADDLVAAAIAQLRPVHRFPSADSYWNPKDNTTRPSIKSFQRIADIASDSSSDAESVESGVDSVASSRTSVVSHGFSLLAAIELANCLLENAELGVIYKAALESGHVGADRFERNFRRILNQYSRDLKQEARNRWQTSAAVLVRRRSRYIANTLVYELECPTRRYRHDHIPHREDRGNLNILKFEQYLRFMKGLSSSSSSDEPCIKDFMFTSKAFLAFRATVWQLVDHSLKLNLGRLTAEIECCRATPIDVSHEAIESISDRIKGVIENFTRSSWDWWPLKPRMGNIPAGYARIRWYCVSTITCHVARANRPSLVARSGTKTCQSFLQSRSLGLPLMLQPSSMQSKEMVKVRQLVIVGPVTLQHRLQCLIADNRANTRVV